MPPSDGSRQESFCVLPGKKKRLLRRVIFLCCMLSCFSGIGSASEYREHQRYLDIITSFPPEFYTPFVTAFSQKYPAIQVQVLNKKTTAALAEIKRGNPHRFDIFWSSSPDAFAMLKAGKLLSQWTPGRRHPAFAIDGVSLDDPDGYFMGFSLSGVGWMWNPAYLKREELPIPGSWKDLTDPIYYGHLAMSTPSRSGTTHLIVESLLQEMGWEKGWATLLQLAGNLRTVSARSFSVPEGLINGRFGVGLGIDFLAQSRKELGFRYGDPAFLVPASIAMIVQGNNPHEATLFVDFILSPEGQKILLEPTVSRLPVSRELHARISKEAEPALFALIRKKRSKPYDAEQSCVRYHLVNQLFDRMITYRLTDRRSLWKRFLALEKRSVSAGVNVGTIKAQLTSLLSDVPVTEAQSQNSAFNAPFIDSGRGTARNQAQQQHLQHWETFVSQRMGQAKALLTKAEADLLRHQR
ncbi:extracellular solute-binding protein [Desulfoluna sp.]|uniref:ABC transporter substrate-binding protein n=1 Tax=Desulfoluna sp. TaxID=2045199 RepID=UPI002624429F|nr:extracellular solute-binding protein [Desulfoluna sp.]